MLKNNLVDQWLTSEKVSKKYKNEIKKMDQKTIESIFDNSLMTFGTAGIRAKMGPGVKQLNEFTFAQLAFGYAKFIKKTFPNNPSVVVGHDNRINSKEFSLLCAKILSSFKIKVYLFKNNQLMPTPIISYVIRELKASGGIIITASHNPKEYNGFKAYNPDGGQILPDVADQVCALMPKSEQILNLKFVPNFKFIEYIDNKYISNYIFSCRKALVDLNIINETKKFPIVFTGHHGTSCKLLPIFLKTLKFNIKPVFKQCFYNGEFINSPSSNPENYDSFDLAIKYANKIDSKIIIGVDPDADRMAIMIKKNNNWRLMSGNEMGILYTYYILKNKSFFKTPFIISSYVSTNLIDRIAKKYKAKVYRTGTGFKWMGSLITQKEGQENFVVAFEEAIGALNTTLNRDKDSFGSSALALEIYYQYSKKNMDFVDILNKEIYPKFGYWFGKTVSYSYANEFEWKSIVKNKLKILEKMSSKNIGPYLLKNISWNKNGDCLDWILNNDSWIRFRASGTEPKFKVYYNLYASSSKVLENNFKKISQIISKLLK